MRLTLRDKLIFETLKNQEFCFYKDICKSFFPSKSSASQSLKRLVKSGHIVIEPVEKFNKNYFDDLSVSLFSNNHFVIRLGDKYKTLERKPSYWKRTHQLLLFSVKERLEKLLSKEAIFENQIKELKHTLYDRDFQPVPDFYIKGEGYNLAVELELNLKSTSRYFFKMSEYGKSNYSHVLYVSTHGKKTSKLINIFKYKKYIGIAHYADLEKLVSYRYGKQTLLDWLKKRTK